MGTEEDINNILLQYVCPLSGETFVGVPNIAITGAAAALGFLLMKGKGLGMWIGGAGLAGTAAIGYAKYVKNLC